VGASTGASVTATTSAVRGAALRSATVRCGAACFAVARALMMASPGTVLPEL